MAGTIRKMTGHSLIYSKESSAFFSNSVTLSQCSSESNISYDLDADFIEFDLRNESEEPDQCDLVDAPTLMSEPVLELADAPLSGKEPAVGAECSTGAVTPSPSPEPERIPVRRDASKLSQLVDELLDSPSKQIASTSFPKPLHRSPVAQPPAGDVFPVTRLKTPFPGVVPLTLRNRLEKERQIAKTEKVFKTRIPSRALKSDGWICPDSWIPNHRCDNFCLETLRSSI